MIRIILCNFRLISTHNTDTTDEVFDILNLLSDLRHSNPSIFHDFEQLFLALEIFLINLSTNLGEQFLARINTALRSYIKGMSKGEVNSRMLEINLKFILELTNNQNFMDWAKSNKYDLFKIMKTNKRVSHVTNDLLILANKIHHNLLKNYSYSAKFLFNS